MRLTPAGSLLVCVVGAFVVYVLIRMYTEWKEMRMYRLFAQESDTKDRKKKNAARRTGRAISGGDKYTRTNDSMRWRARRHKYSVSSPKNKR